MTADNNQFSSVSEFHEEFAYVLHPLVIQAVKRFVQDEDARILHQGLSYPNRWFIPMEYLRTLFFSSGSRPTYPVSRHDSLQLLEDLVKGQAGTILLP